MTATKRFAGTRWVVIALLVVSAVINFMDRGSLSVAAPTLSSDLELKPIQVGFLLSAFFWTYAACQILAGWLADRYSVFTIFAAGFFIWSIATFAAGFAGGLVSLMILRLLLGAGESVAVPSYSRLIATTFPADERGLPNALIEAGTKLGPALGTLVGGLLVASYGWRILFIGLGAGSLLWLVPWLIWGPRTDAGTAVHVQASTHASMLRILENRSAWGTFIGNACYTYAYFFLLTWLPSYLVSERHVSLRMMGILGSVPFGAAALAAVLSGWFSDRLIRRGASPTRVRKSFVGAGLLCSTIMVPSVIVSDLKLSIVLLCLAYVAFGVFASNHWAITQTLAGPEAAGRWAGMQNTIGALSGIVAPVVTGWIVQTTGSFFWAFVSPAVLAVVGAFAYVFIVGPVAPVDWHRT